MQHQELPVVPAPGEADDPETLAPVSREHEPWFEDDTPIRAMDPWSGVRGLALMALGVVGVFAVAWGTGILAPPTGEGGPECERSCTSLGHEVVSFDNGHCICAGSGQVKERP